GFTFILYPKRKGSHRVDDGARASGQESTLNAQSFHALVQPQVTATPLGRVFGVRGSQATIGILQPLIEEDDDARVTVGKFVSIRTGQSLLIGVITEISIQTEPI